MKEVRRTEYLNWLNTWREKGIIKVITGVRRSGKSTLMRQFEEELMLNGVQKEQIIHINFEDMNNSDLLEAKSLHDYLMGCMHQDKMNFIFLDEVQLVQNFQRAVNSLYLRQNVDIYLTGSNSYILSGELATLLSGRYVSINILPLSFSEFMQQKEGYKQDVYETYITTSSFPYSLRITDSTALHTYLEDIFSTIVLRDIVSRQKVQDVNMLTRIIRFMADNIGNLTTAKRIADTITSDGYKVSPQTVDNYLQYMCDSYLLYPASRYDIHGKDFLRQGQKYYIVDIGLRTLLLGGKRSDVGRILENLVFLELLRRGNKVYVGKVDQLEIDFVAVGREGTKYYQISQSVLDENTLRRELSPFKALKDNYPKYLITLDNLPLGDYDGIKHIYALDWLLGKE